jgi:hypothetical protein
MVAFHWYAAVTAKESQTATAIITIDPFTTAFQL